MEDQSTLESEFGSQLSHVGRNHIAETIKWAKFISIVGFVVIGLMVIMAFGMGAIFGMLEGNLQQEAQMPFPSFLFTVIYLIIALIYFFPVYYLYQFTSKMKTAIKTENGRLMDEAFGYLKAHYKFIGIIIAIGVGLYVVVLFFSLIGGLF